MGSSIAFAAVSAALAIQSAAIPPSPAPLKPSSPWNVEYADSMCLLQRSFGSGEQGIILGFRPGMFSEHMRLVVVRKSAEKSIVRGKAQLSFDGGAPLKVPYMEHFLPSRDVRVIVIDLQQPDLAPLHKAKQFWIQAGQQGFTLAPTAVSAAMKALEACERDLLVTWGMDSASVASITEFPKARGGIVSFFSTDDYPSGAIRNKEQGTAGVRFWVSTLGTIRDCKVVESSGSAILDRQTCAIITKRGRFEPARNAGREAVESIGFQRVRWELPGF